MCGNRADRAKIIVTGDDDIRENPLPVKNKVGATAIPLQFCGILVPDFNVFLINTVKISANFYCPIKPWL